MKRRTFLLALLLAAGTINSAGAQQRILCSSPSDTTCPKECRKDLSHHYGLVKPVKLPATTAGVYFGPTVSPGLKAAILINSELPARYVEAAKHHEACHAEMAIVTGSHVFHP